MFQNGLKLSASSALRKWQVGAGVIATATLLMSSAPAHAQTFVHYMCEDGTPVVAAFFPQDKRARIQVDGKSLTLPQRLSADGGRYARRGVSFWIKGQQATLKRPKTKPTICKVQ